jgi:hypothetical protein
MLWITSRSCLSPKSSLRRTSRSSQSLSVKSSKVSLGSPFCNSMSRSFAFMNSVYACSRSVTMTLLPARNRVFYHPLRTLLAERVPQDVQAERTSSWTNSGSAKAAVWMAAL